jgi:hypothetical protein
MAQHEIIFEHASVAKLARPDARLPARPLAHKTATSQPKKKDSTGEQV